MSAAVERPGLLGLVASDTRQAFAQFTYEQRAFWRNPTAAIFTVGFSIVFLLLLGATGGKSKSDVLPGVPLIQYYVAMFCAYGIMAACFNNLSLTMVIRRETGQLKRLRLSPLPVSSMLGAIFLNALTICALQILLLLVIGRYGYGVHLPNSWAPFIVALVVGVACFMALGVAVSTLVPNQEAAGPLVNIVFFVIIFVSGLWYPIDRSSTLAKIADWFPIRHFLLAVFSPFDVAVGGAKGSSAWDWGDLRTVVIWGAIAVVVAARRFRFEPVRR